jgi:uncharacterized protein (DUF927 family)
VEIPLEDLFFQSLFASPLLKLLGHRVFFIHIWHDSGSGKTAAIKTAVSV